MIGRTMSSCFKIHGYSDWYKGLKNHISQATMRENLASTTSETLLDYTDIAVSHNEDASSHQTSTDIDLSTIIQREIEKYMKDKGSNTPIGLAHSNFAGISSGTILSCNLNTIGFTSKQGTWIIDIGTTNHMCNDLSLLEDANDIHPPLEVFLPDGRTHLVHKSGRVTLTHTICLTNVLYIPQFSFNLWSVHHLCDSGNVRFHFSSTSCYL